MTANGWLQIALFCLAIVLVTKPLGSYLVAVYEGRVRWLAAVERGLYRLAGVDPEEDQHWTAYAAGMLLFSAASLLLTYAVLRLQHLLPLNPQGFAAVPDRQAFETAASFTSNTNWQSYGGESTMSYFSQMTQLTFHNFTSAAVGMALAVALVRGISRRSAGRLGNFWADLVRGTLYVLLPLSLVIALILVQQGAIQNLRPYLEVTTLEGAKQTIAMGPVAGQEAIKQLGTNGGGFFNANAAHPFENPTPWTNFWSMVAIFMIPSALTWLLGRMTRHQRHGWAVWSAMAALFLTGAMVAYWAEARGNPIHAERGIELAPSNGNPGGNMEGKEVRFGIANSALYATVTTAASCGAVNAMHDSFTPLGGLVPLVNIQLGEVIFGGVGAGLYGMLVMVVLTVFIAGLMVGRTPEYLGKRIQAREVQMAMLYVLVFPAMILVLAGLSAVLPAGLRGLNNAGPHGLSEILYAFSSTTGNNGSAFAGLTGSTYYYNTLFGIAMLVGRFAMIVPMLALGGFLSERRIAPQTVGTFPVTTPLFVVLLIGVIVIVGALTFFPALSLGPIVEHFLMLEGSLLVTTAQHPLFHPPIVRRALRDSVYKLRPRHMVRNPVMFVVLAGAVLTTLILGRDILAGGGSVWFTLQLALWLWFTVLFANFAEAMAEGRGKAQADALRGARMQTRAKRMREPGNHLDFLSVFATELRRGDHVLVQAGDLIPADGEVVEGVASVDESAVTGESAPVIREAGGDRSAVTGGTRVLSDWLVVRVTANPGETFIDRMIALVEGAVRQKTPNEIALTILLSGLTVVFLLAVVTLRPFAIYGGSETTVPVLIALLVCLIPTTIGGLLSAIGIAGMDRLIQQNVIAMSGRAVEAAGDVNTLLLDKTGTITLGNRHAVEFLPVGGIRVEDLADRAQLASLPDETPEGRSIVVLAKERFALRGRSATGGDGQPPMTFVPFSAATRMSGVNVAGRQLRKGATDAVTHWVAEAGGAVPPETGQVVETIARQGGTPLVVAERRDGAVQVLGVVHLKDVVKGGMKERFDRLRAMGIRTVMITGDNPLTAAAIAAEAGVDDFLAEATPEQKLELIRKEQAGGRLVAMTGDGTNDAPALAQADVGVAMNTGTQAAREAGNMVDLDSNPTKLIEIVEIGKQLLMTRGSLTTFSIANDVAKYFAIVPAMFVATYPQLDVLNVMRLASPRSAILSSVIFNALIIIALIPLALRGVGYRPAPASVILRRNLMIYGVGGLLVPFAGIKLIDVILSAIGLV